MTNSPIFVLIALLITLAIYALVLIVAAWVSVHPFRTPAYITPAQLEAPQEDVCFDSDGHAIRGWWVEAKDATCVVICAHGYMMNRSELVSEARMLWARGVSCLLIDFRAHGRSGGRKCSMGHFERNDIVAAVRFAQQRVPGARIGLIGSSMGAAAGALALGENPELFSLAVLDSAYSELSSAALGWWRFLGGELLVNFLRPVTILALPIGGFNPYKVDVAKALANTKLPILFLHGDRDTLALPSQVTRNYSHANGPKRLVWFAGCGHCGGRWDHSAQYRAELLEFFRENGFLSARAA